MTAPPTVSARPPLHRRPGRAPLAGVAAGLADHLGLDPLVVRLAFILLTIAGGSGLLMYAVFWVVLPAAPGADDAVPHAARLAQPLAFGLFALGALLVLTRSGVLPAGVAWPAVLGAVGVALIWRQADEAQRERWRSSVPTALPVGGRLGLLRLAAGALLIGAGVVVFLAAQGDLSQAANGLAATAVVVAGIALITAPWWVRLTADLTAERRERIRSQERADIAAHLHDSVLQTLALIQRNAADPKEVQRLARSQERELRSWLYRAPPLPDARLGAALEHAAAEVEEDHRAAFDVVVVGDAPVDDRVTALVHAAREAMVNAAKFAGDEPISVYAEVEEDRVTVFVRDRGPGFDADAVHPGRYGVAESIRGRMARAGGTATIRSSGAGTEVQLGMPREGS